MQDLNGWGMPDYEGFLKFNEIDESGISVTKWNHMINVAPHRHYYYEFALILKGCCMHRYKGVSIPLLPGDVFFVLPGEKHSYEIEAPVEILNCQFFGKEMEERYSDIIQGFGAIPHIPFDDAFLVRCWRELLMLLDNEDYENKKIYPSRQINLDKQGTVHLDARDRREIEFFLNNIVEEQRKEGEDYQIIKSKNLELILLKIKRIVKRAQAESETERVRFDDSRQNKIYEVLSYMEKNMTETLDVKQLAEKVYWSEGYFRNVFKNVTGLTPVEYMNRLRIMKSLEYIQKDDVNISEAAERVGIYDPSYYSRLFKKYMGYSPRNFKKN